MEMMVITPDVGVPIPEKIDYPDLLEKAKAACATAQLLGEHGLDLTVNQEAKDVAAAVVTAYAVDPEGTSKSATPHNLATLSPASIVHANEILQEFAHPVVKHAMQLRHLVTTKLILETENANPSIRIKALELLGKFAEVGLFVEKQEITITHQSTDDLRQKLRAKLDKIMGKDQEVQDVVDVGGEIIDVDAELGFKEPEEVEKEEPQEGKDG